MMYLKFLIVVSVCYVAQGAINLHIDEDMLKEIQIAFPVTGKPTISNGKGPLIVSQIVSIHQTDDP